MQEPPKCDFVYILGAGFSWYGGLPLQNQFVNSLLAARDFSSGPSKPVVRFLSDFVKEVFGQDPDAAAELWPQLEDIFTCIDLSANTGHHLGAFSASRLRTIRRALIYRMIRMLKQDYDKARKDKGERWTVLDSFFRKIDLERSAFINMNWDTLIEYKIEETSQNFYIDYLCQAIPASFPKGGTSIDTAVTLSGQPLPLVKMHGSINWLYCDSCRQLYSFPPAQTIKIADQLLGRDEWKRILAKEWKDLKDTHPYSSKQWTCIECPRIPLGTRLATFSYRKALDFPMFHRSWFSAEALLKKANYWVFIGYSLPAADYEFKYLLKRVQLSRSLQPQLILITGGSAAQITAENYRRFFGKCTFFKKGITDKALSYLASLP